MLLRGLLVVLLGKAGNAATTIAPRARGSLLLLLLDLPGATVLILQLQLPLAPVVLRELGELRAPMIGLTTRHAYL